mmetsp:Transcript_27223/g.56719  ORF Transcript_27223/g.56719 Transcript_27223/m.56719 type:complete len:156 (-) Transcript_27223:37-504(-)
MPSFNKQLLRRKAEKLPLAISIHYNIYFSFIFAVLIGRLVFEKHRYFYFCNAFQRSLLVPVYCIWLVAEIPRLYVGQRGVLKDKLPEMAAFLLLSFFPQVFTILYLGFLQEIIFPFDTVLGVTMLLVVVLELILAWRFLSSIITRQSATFYRNIN